jgi:lysophospholipase L1-like esterase
MTAINPGPIIELDIVGARGAIGESILDVTRRLGLDGAAAHFAHYLVTEFDGTDLSDFLAAAAVAQEYGSIWDTPFGSIAASAPGSPTEGVKYINTSNTKGYIYTSGAWVGYTPKEAQTAWVGRSRYQFEAVWGWTEFPSTRQNLRSTPCVVFEGDSRTVGPTGTPYTDLVSLPLSYGVAFETHNVGFSGQGLVAILEEGTKVVAPLLNADAGSNLTLIFAGTNDWASSRTASAAFNTLRRICVERRLMGFRPIVCTEISRGGTFSGVTGDQFKNSFNSLVRKYWHEFADGCADLASNALLGADGAYANTTYFSDGTHQTDAGRAIIASLVGDEITRVIAGRSGAPNTGTTFNPFANWRMTGADSGVLQGGVLLGGAGAWLQSADISDFSASYPLFINPNGGKVKIGGNLTDPAAAQLHTALGSSGNPVSTGTTQTYGVRRTQGGNSAVLDEGMYASTAGYWAQCGDAAALGTRYPMTFQPLGGAFKVGGDFTLHPSASNTPTVNGDLTFEATSNTSLTVKFKGSDGTVRSVVLTLA